LTTENSGNNVNRNIMAGKMERNKLNDIELALVVRLSFLISLTTKSSTSYSEIPENPGGLVILDQSRIL
jgi:hypothetical protein